MNFYSYHFINMAENVEIPILDWVKLIYGGFIYVPSKLSINGKTFWEWQKLHREDCKLKTFYYVQ